PDSNPPTNPQPEDPKPPTTPENPTPPTTHPPAGGGSMPGGITVDESKLVGPSNPYTTRRIKNAGYSKTPGSSGVGEFRVNCYYSHMSFDDPIVFPGKTRATHLHTFFGNSGANANSTTDSILNSGGSTCTGGTVNRTGYWVPSVIDTRTNAPVILTPDYS